MNHRLPFFRYAEIDFKLILRDRSLIIFLILPVLILAFLRWAIPFISGVYPELATYYQIIIGMMAVVISVFPGFIMAFIVIDENEQHVLQVLRVLPISFIKFIYNRIWLTAIVSFIYCFIILRFSGLVTFNIVKTMQIAVLSSFLGPVSALIILAFADNKIEGMTYMKGLNFVWIIPVAHFFIDSSWKYVFAIIPDYWTLQLVYVENNSMTTFTVGFFYHLVLLLIATRLFVKKIKS